MKKSGFVVAVLVIVAIGLLSWYVFGRGNGVATDVVDRHAVGDTMATVSTGLGFGARVSDRSAAPTGAATGTHALPPSFAKSDIHNVPLGTILDYAVEVVQYDSSRARSMKLPANAKGQSPAITVTPAEGTLGMTRATMAEGHVIARIESDGEYADLGLASGRNYLWVGTAPNGQLEWVLIPATAFNPLKDLTEAQANRLN